MSYLVGDLALVLHQVSQLRSSYAETTAYLAAVQVPQVEGVARELHAICPLDKRCAVSLCPQISSKSRTLSLSEFQSLTGDLPRKVSGNSGGHFNLL
jgi:hypothetical protein